MADRSSGDTELDLLHRFWQAANYLTVAQIYLCDNPLLREPLKPDHIKPRLLGHWGTSPGLSLIYAHLNRLIRNTNAEVLYLAGPGHGGPALVANTYLEGSFGERYPRVGAGLDGLQALVRQFSTPGGISSHVGVQVPGSIHEGGELGYALAHATGAALDNPNLLVACVIGDGEAETAPLEGSWKAPAFLSPVHDGAVLPILHANGYKISGPTVLGRQSDDRIAQLMRAHGWEPVVVAGDEPAAVHAALALALDGCHRDVVDLQQRARRGQTMGEYRWPAIILRTPKGWTGPVEVDGVRVEGTFRAHQVPISAVRSNPEHLAALEEWLRSYEPARNFDVDGRLVPELQELVPRPDRRMGRAWVANGGGPEPARLSVPPAARYEVRVTEPGMVDRETTRPLGEMLRDIIIDTNDDRTFRLFCPDETTSNRLGAVFEATDRCSLETTYDTDDHVGPDGRVMEVLSEHLCQGWLEGYLLTGRHGLFATYEAFAMVSASMTVQHAKWLQHAREIDWRTPVPSLNILLTSTCWRNDHNGFSHQGPGLIDTVLALSGDVVRVYLPPDANSLLVVVEHCLRSHDYVNLLVVDKQSHPQYLTLDEAREHAAAGASIWRWAGTDDGTGQPDVVLACVGDIPTQETISAAALLKRFVPRLRVRVVNVIDLMSLTPGDIHPHGMSDEAFSDLFTDSGEVIMAWHGYARGIHALLHGRSAPQRFHVRGYVGQGTTTTPFDMVVVNRMSRYHLAQLALDHCPDVAGAAMLRAHCDRMLAQHHLYIREHLTDMPEVAHWSTG